jgi:dihydrofolate synthase / folylpolyglutamate synthase
MNYRQTLDFLYSALPMFHRIGAAAYKPDLNNTIALLDAIGNPHLHLKCIHIAGTNGKGSTSHMIASVLQEAGYRTGLYTSPHLKDFRERIRVNGTMISRNKVISFVEHNRNVFERVQPSFFEMTVAMAFWHFLEKKTDVAVIETGLGGRLDSTNVIHPLISVITNISYDHMSLLGDSLQKIAHEKAGIIKPETPVVIGESQRAVLSVFRNMALQQRAPVYIADRHYNAETVKRTNNELTVSVLRNNRQLYKKLGLDLIGTYQLKNLCTVLQAIEVLQPVLPVPERALIRGLQSVKRNTNLRGRWEVLENKPLVIADTGHNEGGIREILLMLQTIKYRTLHFVLGVVSDKDIDGILKLLPRQAVYYFCKAGIPRGMDASALQFRASSFRLKGFVYPSVKKAYQSALRNAAKNDLVFIGGSTFTVAEIL